MECASCLGALLYDDLACTRQFCTTCRCQDLSHASFCACETRETGTPRQGKAKRKRASIQKNVLSPSALALHQLVTTESTTQATMAYFEFTSAHFCPLPGCRATDYAIMQNNDGRLRSKKYFIIARAVKQCVDGLVELFACNCDADGLQLQLLLLKSSDIHSTAECKEAYSSSSAPCAHREVVQHDLGRSVSEILAVVAAVDDVEDHMVIISNRASDGGLDGAEESDHELRVLCHAECTKSKLYCIALEEAGGDHFPRAVYRDSEARWQCCDEHCPGPPACNHAIGINALYDDDGIGDAKDSRALSNAEQAKMDPPQLPMPYTEKEGLIWTRLARSAMKAPRSLILMSYLPIPTYHALLQSPEEHKQFNVLQSRVSGGMPTELTAQPHGLPHAQIEECTCTDVDSSDGCPCWAMPKCKCGAEWDPLSRFCLTEDAVLITTSGLSHDFKLNSIRCSSAECDCMLLPDGRDEGLFIASKKRVYDHLVMYQHIMRMQASGETFEAQSHVSAMMGRLQTPNPGSNGRSAVANRQRFNEDFGKWLRLRQMSTRTDNSKDSMTCPECVRHLDNKSGK